MIKIISVCLIFEGILWFIAMLLFLGIIYSPENLIDYIKMIIYYIIILIGPFCLIAGPIFVLKNIHSEFWVSIILVAVSTVTAFMLESAFSWLNLDPLRARPSYEIDVPILIYVIIMEAGAIWLAKIIFSSCMVAPKK